MPTVTVTHDSDLADLRRANNRLQQRMRCTQPVSCIARERERKLTQEERCQFPQWSERPYGALNLNRMCRACQAYWHGEMSARLREHSPGVVVDGERPLPQKG